MCLPSIVWSRCRVHDGTGWLWGHPRPFQLWKEGGFSMLALFLHRERKPGRGNPATSTNHISHLTCCPPG